MGTVKAFVSGYDYIQDIHLEPGMYTVMMKVKSMYGDTCSFALYDGEWAHYDMQTVQNEWRWAYVTFRILKPVTKINLISRNYSSELPVYVVQPQIVAGNMPFDAGVNPMDLNKDSEELKAVYKSMEYLKQAIRQDASIEGALLTLVTILLKEDMDASVTAGFSGIQRSDLEDPNSPKDAPAFWAGGTYADAINDTAKSIDRHDGSGHRAGGRIKWDKDGKTTLYDVIVKGSYRSPFEYCPDSFRTDYSDNVAVISSGGGWIQAFSLPWDVNQSGRRITITNYKWGSSIAEGYAGIVAPSGKYFFENGIAKSSIDFSREAIELLGYGDSENFYGWIIVGRVDLMATYGYGNPLKALAMGQVIGNDVGATIKYQTFDGSTLNVSRLATGRYKITLSSSGWFSDTDNFIVMATGLGYSYGASTPIKATITERASSYFIVDTSDDDTHNDGSFMFIIFNMADWH